MNTGLRDFTRAEKCEKAITLTDTLSAHEELNGVRAMLKALYRSLALYPKGFSYIEYAAKTDPAQPWMLYSGNRRTFTSRTATPVWYGLEDRAR